MKIKKKKLRKNSLDKMLMKKLISIFLMDLKKKNSMHQ